MSETTILKYNEKASTYEEKWKHYLEHTHRAFLQRITTTENDRLLDASGGTGLLARRLIDQHFPFKKLIVNEPAEKMQEIAQEKLKEENYLQFTGFRVKQIPQNLGPFDQIFCLNSFHFYPDQPKVLELFSRLLKPSGRVYILDWNRAGLFVTINKLIAWSSSEYIDTRSQQEMNIMLKNADFDVSQSESWNWRYWKFFFITADKK